MAQTATTQKKNEDISVFDVKELYDRAYDRKAQTSETDDLFKQYLAQAVKMDLAYRRQLSNNTKDKKNVILQEAANNKKQSNKTEVA